MSHPWTQAIEDYLKSIYALTSEAGRASTTQIAERLGVTPASVTGMLQKMASTEPPLVVYHKHRGVALTPAGQAAALRVIRHHRLLELFLHQTLGYSWDEVHTEADRLEHFISTEFEERMARALGDPQRDPHGQAIPDRNCRLPDDSPVRLSQLRPGQQAVIQRVEDDRPELLRHLAGLGLTPQARVTILEFSILDGNLRLQIDDRPAVVLGPAITGHIYVENLTEKA